MKKWTWISAVLVAGALVTAAWVIPAFAQGTPTQQNPPATTPGDADWSDMMSTCQGIMGSEGMMGGSAMMGNGMMGMTDQATLDSLAGVLGLAADQLTSRLAAGETLAQIAQSQGVATSAVVDALLTWHNRMMQAAVTSGHMTEAQAQAMLDQMRQWIETAINTPWPAAGDTAGACGSMMSGGMMNGGTTNGGMMGGNGMMGNGGMMGGGMMGGGGMMNGGMMGGGMMGGNGTTGNASARSGGMMGTGGMMR